MKAGQDDLGETLEQRTGSGGSHLVFDRRGYEGTIKSSSSEDGLDVRADGGYIVAAPSSHASGNRYAWINPDLPVAVAPDWLCKWAAERKPLKKGQVKKDLSTSGQGRHSKAVPHSPEEEASVISALKVFRTEFVDNRQNWFNIGAPLHSTGWSNIRSLFDEWAMGSERYGGTHGFPGSDKYDEQEQEKLWRSFDRQYDGEKLGLGTLYNLAEKHGWVNLKKTHYTDLGNARRLVARHGPNIRYVVEWGKWLIWKNNRWYVDNDYKVVRLAKETVGAMHSEAATIADEEARKKLRIHALASEDARRIKAMVEMTKSELGVPISATLLDSNPYLLGVQNGVIDLETFEFREARREDYVTMYCNVHYDPRAKCPKWLKFLDRIMARKAAIIGYLQRFTGYGLTGSVEEEVMQMLWGDGKNGKSTYRETINILMGDYAATFGVELLLSKESPGAATPEIARLKGVKTCYHK